MSKVRLLNIGFSAVRWKFAVKPGTQEVCPPWIRVSPRMGIIAPGEVCLLLLLLFVSMPLLFYSALSNFYLTRLLR